MATTSPSIILASTSTTNHRNWINAFSAALDTLGVVKTTDTGQVNLTPTTLALPPSTAGTANLYMATTPVYQIRKLSASGMPDIFIRFEFGIWGNDNTSNAQTAYAYPGLRITVGGGTNGAGVITRVQSDSVAFFDSHSPNESGFTGSASSGSTKPSTVAQVCDFASDGQNYLTIMLGENAPNFENYSVLGFALERTIDPNTGLYDASGWVAYNTHLATSNGGVVWHYGDFVNQREWAGTQVIPAITPPFNIAATGSDVLTFPLIGSTMVPKGAPLAGISYYTAALAAPVAFPMTVYSATHTFKACPRGSTPADSWNTGTKLALRFE